MNERLRHIEVIKNLISLGLIAVALTTAFSKANRREWFMREFSAECQHCDRSWDDGWMLEYDHIDPQANGGGDKLENAQLLCQVCHYKKHVEAGEIGAANLIMSRIQRTQGRNIHYEGEKHYA